MARLKFQGPLALRLRSLIAINRIALQTWFRHATGRRMAPDWAAGFEIGVRFWRHQFKAALSEHDIARGRAIFDSLLTETDDHYDVTVEPCTWPKGDWFYPGQRSGDTTVLHFHGGGYSFYGSVGRRFATMLAHHIRAPVFAPDYRLTPEHPHPAQADDAIAAWEHLSRSVPPERIVVTGDSAGGHMALMLLQSLRARGLPQPAICVGLCPWTDIGDRGESLRGNDRFDLVQGWMALQFGQWLDPNSTYGREALSPCFQNFAGLAPIYVQAGGREVLRDMIVEFVEIQRAHGAKIELDLWNDMPHDFQAYDSLKPSSVEALARLAQIIQARRLPERG
ncbi:MAG: alpha/beta hydrolase [Rhizobiaceae bacterium]